MENRTRRATKKLKTTKWQVMYGQGLRGFGPRSETRRATKSGLRARRATNQMRLRGRYDEFRVTRDARLATRRI